MKKPKTSINNSLSYARRVSFDAPRERVYDAIATLAGLRGWWTPRVRGSGAVGGELRFEFEGLEECIVMRVDAAERPSSVRWSCVVHTSLDEWKNHADVRLCGGDADDVRVELPARGPHASS